MSEAVAAAKADLRTAAGVLTSHAHVSTSAEGAGLRKALVTAPVLIMPMSSGMRTALARWSCQATRSSGTSCMVTVRTCM